jgi:lipocalin
VEAAVYPVKKFHTLKNKKCVAVSETSKISFSGPFHKYKYSLLSFAEEKREFFSVKERRKDVFFLACYRQFSVL